MTSCNTLFEVSSDSRFFELLGMTGENRQIRVLYATKPVVVSDYTPRLRDTHFLIKMHDFPADIYTTSDAATTAAFYFSTTATEFKEQSVALRGSQTMLTRLRFALHTLDGRDTYYDANHELVLVLDFTESYDIETYARSRNSLSDNSSRCHGGRNS